VIEAIDAAAVGGAGFGGEGEGLVNARRDVRTEAPQGLKPIILLVLFGTTEVVPFQSSLTPIRF
jgi:hypothetical protein